MSYIPEDITNWKNPSPPNARLPLLALVSIIAAWIFPVVIALLAYSIDNTSVVNPQASTKATGLMEVAIALQFFLSLVAVIAGSIALKTRAGHKAMSLIALIGGYLSIVGEITLIVISVVFVGALVILGGSMTDGVH